MKILVTGGTGFVGRHIVAAALSAGHEVAVLTRGKAVSPPAVACPGDLSDRTSMQKALEGFRPQAIVHAAAIVDHRDPLLQSVNVSGTTELARLATDLDPKPRLVFLSSFAVEDPPPTAYSESKARGERAVADSGLPFVILRPTLIYGARDEGNTGRLVQKMRAGTSWLPAGGRALIQPVHVEDVAQACVAACERPAALGKSYRLGGAAAVSVREWRTAVRDASGGKAVLRAIPRPLFALAAHALALLGRRGARDVLTFHSCDHRVDSSEARRDLGFAPRSLSDGLAATFPLSASEPASGEPPSGRPGRPRD